MMPFASPYGAPLYWSFHERPEAWHIDPFHQYAKQLAFFGGGRFTHSTHYHDSSLYGNHGTLTNMDPATDWVRELGRPALDFDGSDDCVNLGIGVYGSGVKVISVSIWASYTGLIGRLCGRYDNTVPGSSWMIYLSSGKVVFYTGPVIGNFNLLANNASNDGDWHNFVVVYDGAVKYIYIDGVLNTFAAYISTLSTNSTVTYIGSTVSPSYFAGFLADPMIWSRALSPSEISALADPSNVMLSLGGSDPGLIVPDDLVYPVYLPSSVVAGAKPALWLGVCV